MMELELQIWGGAHCGNGNWGIQLRDPLRECPQYLIQVLGIWGGFKLFGVPFWCLQGTPILWFL